MPVAVSPGLPPSQGVTKPASSPTPAAPLLTSGQHEPDHALLQPYSAFPKQVTGRTVWKREDFLGNEALWKRRWNTEHVRELEAAYEAFRATGKGLPEITRETFPLPSNVSAFLHSIRNDVVNGPGFTLIQGLPVNEWEMHKTAAIYLAIGQQFGRTLSQNKKGHVLGHVKDLGNDPTQIDKVRIYSTSARQFFHTDSSDIVGLLCLHKAKEGGESECGLSKLDPKEVFLSLSLLSCLLVFGEVHQWALAHGAGDVVSAHHVWNALQAERPDVAELLATPNWYFDRKGEVSDGQQGWVQKAVFYWYDGHLLSHYDPYYVKSSRCHFRPLPRVPNPAAWSFVRAEVSVTRFVEAGLIPGHSPAQLEAIQVLEETAQRLSLHMVLAVGDIQFVADTHVFHARTAYVDYPAPAPRRHLLRLWLSTPTSEGGWKRPYPDSDHVKRGGIQVNEQPETCPLDAE